MIMSVLYSLDAPPPPPTLQSSDVVSVVIPVLGALKDSCSVNDKLLKDFKTYEGYKLLTSLILEVSPF